MIEVADHYGILRSGNSNGLHSFYINHPTKVLKCKQRSPALFAFAFQPQKQLVSLWLAVGRLYRCPVREAYAFLSGTFHSPAVLVSPLFMHDGRVTNSTHSQ